LRKSVPSKPFAKAAIAASKTAPFRLSIRPIVLYGSFAALLLTNVM